MKKESRKVEIEKLEREVADLQRMARPEVPTAELDRLRTEVAATAPRVLRAHGRLAAHAAGAPSAAALHDGLSCACF